MQDPATKEYMIVMQYANNGNLLSYLDQNINKLTWMDKLRCLDSIAACLWNIHDAGVVHCDLHGGNIVLDHCNDPLICDFGLSRSLNSHGWYTDNLQYPSTVVIYPSTSIC